MGVFHGWSRRASLAALIGVSVAFGASGCGPNEASEPSAAGGPATPTVVASMCRPAPVGGYPAGGYPAPVPARISGFISYDDGPSISGVIDAEVRLLDATGSALIARTISLSCEGRSDIGYFEFLVSQDLPLSNGNYTLQMVTGGGESPDLSNATPISDPDDPTGTPSTPNVAVVTHPGANNIGFVYGP